MFQSSSYNGTQVIAAASEQRHQEGDVIQQKEHYGPDTMAGIARLVARKEINITDLDSILPDDVKTISKELKLNKISRKTNKMLIEEIKYVARMYIAGQGE